MPAVSEFLTAIPLSALAVVALVRYLPDAILTVLAGVVALFSRDHDRGRRAMTVLRILRARRHGSAPPDDP